MKDLCAFVLKGTISIVRLHIGKWDYVLVGFILLMQIGEYLLSGLLPITMIGYFGLCALTVLVFLVLTVIDDESFPVVVDSGNRNLIKIPASWLIAAMALALGITIDLSQMQSFQHSSLLAYLSIYPTSVGNLPVTFSGLGYSIFTAAIVVWKMLFEPVILSWPERHSHFKRADAVVANAGVGSNLALNEATANA